MSNPARHAWALIWMLGVLAAPGAAADDVEQGFERLFDGQTLSGWQGDPSLWSVQDGAITGATSDDAPIKENQFLIWEGEASDFVLRLEFNIEADGAGNSGVQYRSKRYPDLGRWVVGGYQADIEHGNTYMGILYEEKGRGILAMPGEDVVLGGKQGGHEKKVVGSTGERDDIFRDVRAGEWQRYEIVARGNELTHKINGRVVAHVVDEDAENAAQSGLIALQVHRGGAMKVRFRNIRLKPLLAD